MNPLNAFNFRFNLNNSKISCVTWFLSCVCIYFVFSVIVGVWSVVNYEFVLNDSIFYPFTDSLPSEIDWNSVSISLLTFAVSLGGICFGFISSAYFFNSGRFKYFIRSRKSLNLLPSKGLKDFKLTIKSILFFVALVSSLVFIAMLLSRLLGGDYGITGRALKTPLTFIFFIFQSLTFASIILTSRKISIPFALYICLYSMLIAVVEGSRDSILIILPSMVSTFFISGRLVLSRIRRLFIYLLYTIVLFAVFYATISARSSLAGNILTQLIFSLRDIVFYCTGFSFLNIYNQISTIDSTQILSSADLIQNMNLLSSSYFKGYLYDPVRPVPLSVVAFTNMPVTLNFLIFSGFGFMSWIIISTPYNISRLILFLVCAVFGLILIASYYQYFPRQSFRVLQLMSVAMVLSYKKISFG